MNLTAEKTKDFVAGLIALIFVVTAGYLALNRFNDTDGAKLGTGGESMNAESISADSTFRDDGTVAGSTDSMVYWVANDYELGDIQTGNYTVVSGDTLWELADAAYGDGARWVDILNANADSVGYLPNGEQALIFVGQTLLIP
jgi:nucleoid-associated protein YgaU